MSELLEIRQPYKQAWPSESAKSEVTRGHLARLIANEATETTLTPLGYEPRTVVWGEAWMYESAAYWVARAHEEVAAGLGKSAYALGESFAEEVVACLLGGHGITYEMNLAAFHAVRNAGLISREARATEGELRSVLEHPMLLASGRTARYRFPNQKAQRVASALARVSFEGAPSEAMAAREWLLTFDGIGPKTASWIVRNVWPSANVAIIDIHVWRAGTDCGVFDPGWNPAQNYWEMEALFVEWSRLGGIHPAALDVTVWTERAALARRQ